MRGCRREHEALHLSLMVQLWQADLFPLLPILRAAWASSRNVKAAAGEWSEGLLHPNARVVQQSSRAERQSSGNCWGKKKKERRTVETVIRKMPEYLVPALQSWTYFLWKGISCPPALFTCLGLVQGVLVDAVSWNSLTGPDSYCCCWWAAVWALL